MTDYRVPLAQRADFDDIVDVRTPLEFADDHLPGAINAPVLSNEERVRVGTLYKTSPFEATRLGAALVARNIAHHLDTVFSDRPKHWRPLIYCWRGGKRSGSMTTWMNLIGWRARQLDGGYKAYRQAVREELSTLPAALQYVVLLGPTGSGKTRLLHALHNTGAQVLDLEALAGHRGSLLGAVPGTTQPSQKGFDTRLLQAMQVMQLDRPVFVESESRKIGSVALPQALLDGLYRSPCVRVDASRDARIRFLLEDYRHLFDAPIYFNAQLARLIGLHSRETVGRWQTLAHEGSGNASDHISGDISDAKCVARKALFEELIDAHYDPAYARSSHAHYRNATQALAFDFDPSAGDGDQQAQRLVSRLAQQPASAAVAIPVPACTLADQTSTDR